MKSKFGDWVVGDYANRLIHVLERIATAMESTIEQQERLGFSGQVCECGTIFTPIHGNQKYCKQKCQAKYAKRRSRGPIEPNRRESDWDEESY